MRRPQRTSWIIKYLSSARGVRAGGQEGSIAPYLHQRRGPAARLCRRHARGAGARRRPLCAGSLAAARYPHCLFGTEMHFRLPLLSVPVPIARTRSRARPGTSGERPLAQAFPACQANAGTTACGRSPAEIAPEPHWLAAPMRRRDFSRAARRRTNARPRPRRRDASASIAAREQKIDRRRSRAAILDGTRVANSRGNARPPDAA